MSTTTMDGEGERVARVPVQQVPEEVVEHPPGGVEAAVVDVPAVQAALAEAVVEEQRVSGLAGSVEADLAPRVGAAEEGAGHAGEVGDDVGVAPGGAVARRQGRRRTPAAAETCAWTPVGWSRRLLARGIRRAVRAHRQTPPYPLVKSTQGIAQPLVP